MAKILSFHPNHPELEKENPLKSLWEEFISLDKFAKFFIISYLLIVIATPFIIANYQIFNPQAQAPNNVQTVTSSDVNPRFVPNQLPNLSQMRYYLNLKKEYHKQNKMK